MGRRRQEGQGERGEGGRLILLSQIKRLLSAWAAVFAEGLERPGSHFRMFNPWSVLLSRLKKIKPQALAWGKGGSNLEDMVLRTPCTQ